MLLGQLSEREFMNMVMEAAGRLSWLCFHDEDSRRNAPGWPDLVLLKQGRMICLELKTEKGRIRPEQEVWIAELAQVPGVTARIVRPSDLDEILTLLQEGA